MMRGSVRVYGSEGEVMMRGSLGVYGSEGEVMMRGECEGIWE